jgi:hypothetical protein
VVLAMDEDSKTGKTDPAKAAYSGFRFTQTEAELRLAASYTTKRLCGLHALAACIRPRVGAAGTVAREIPRSKNGRLETEMWRLPE